MKHKPSITLILLAMFLVTQIIGLAVLTMYSPSVETTFNKTTGQEETVIEKEKLPFGLDTGEEEKNTPDFLSIVFALILAFLIFGFLMKYQLKLAIKIWFTVVIIISIGVTIYPLTQKISTIPSILAIAIALPLTYFKIVKPNMIIHNFTELLVYPGIATVVVSVIYSPLNRYSGIIFMIILLILISLYDAWAVWHSGLMQKMAKYQMEKLNIFGGFLLPSLTKKDKEKIKKLKAEYKNKKTPKKVQNKKFKVNLAILGGGDIIFPIITAGVFMWSFPEYALMGIKGLIPALYIVAGSLAGLGYLFLNTKKGKAYPAMPYISAGIFVSMILFYLISF